MSNVQTKPRPDIPCHKCKGTGILPMSDELMATLAVLDDHPRVAVADVIHVLNWKHHPTAINNRLNYLVDLGFLQRKRDGREYYYTKAVPAKKAKT